jgi:hypothetical protein
MIGHQNIGVDRNVALCRGLRQPIAIKAVILLAKENRLPIVAALNHMKRLINEKIPSEPRHRDFSSYGRA